MTLGEKLQKLRKSRGWSQEQLASEIHVSRQALSKWELGSAVPDTENVLRLARLFDVSTDYLLKDELETDERQTAAPPPEKKAFHPRVLIGCILLILGAAGQITLGILSSVCPARVIYGGGQADLTGLAAFLDVYNLRWLFGLCVFSVIAGAALTLSLRFMPVLKKWGKMLGGWLNG